MTSTAELQVVAHATLFEAGASRPPVLSASKGTWPGGREQLRSALSLGEHDNLELRVLVDRSGSVHTDPAATAKQLRFCEQLANIEASGSYVGIDAYDSSLGGVTNIYELKPPVRTPDQALYELDDCGGGGTPTGDAVEYVTRELAGSDAHAKVLVVLTDGSANNVEGCGRAVEAAREQGIVVVGIYQPAAYDSPRTKDDLTVQFGDGQWVTVTNSDDAPQALLALLGFTPVADAPQPTRSPAVESLPQADATEAAADAIRALGPHAQWAFINAHSPGSDPELFAVACELLRSGVRS